MAWYYLYEEFFFKESNSEKERVEKQFPGAGNEETGRCR